MEGLFLLAFSQKGIMKNKLIGLKVQVKSENYTPIGDGEITAVRNVTARIEDLPNNFRRRTGLNQDRTTRLIEKDVVIKLENGKTIYGHQCWWSRK